ncbi:hypothetical protein GUITHDRAFT_113627 [Guillardia theta CCMP2712]|uniref:Uncharacterized protein n=1 Tax=Guillardia theta (strain CCMP2712) TaxID=905079 RepID=L1IWC3_GUITC|nr:hypothetical protein GUITHDRAFT_113627 [Guillardia theta CCMP2712]EKX40387.1 hypothetical protein GUITHDRAFT_113627 [Guillardia theta CCMP2712]|eukprot:XP_005827367.1 hypothetical protein GUITHDRAFT_113627 [Guillardia theta CCMP2712]
MPWNPFKSKKKETIRPGFHPIDIDSLEPVDRRREQSKSERDRGTGLRDDSDCPDSPSGSECSSTPQVLKSQGVGRDALLSAAFKGDLDSVKELLALGPEAKLYVWHTDIVEYLLSTKSIWNDTSGPSKTPVVADAKATNGESDTPLFMAVLSNKLPLVKIIAEACDKDVNLTNIEGFSPLHYAAGEGNLEIARYLVEECGANISARDVLGLTPCFCAVLQGRKDVAEYFLTRSPQEINVVNKGGDTMLHCALKGVGADSGMEDIVQMLITRGAPLDLPGALPASKTVRQIMAKNGLCESFDVDPEPPAHAAASKSSSHSASPVKQGTADGKPEAKDQRKALKQSVVDDSPILKGFLQNVLDTLGSQRDIYGIPKPPVLPEEFVLPLES